MSFPVYPQLHNVESANIKKICVENTHKLGEMCIDEYPYFSPRDKIETHKIKNTDNNKFEIENTKIDKHTKMGEMSSKCML